MGIRTAATALLLLLMVASACHADTGRPGPAVRPLRPSRPSRPSKPPRSQEAPDVSIGRARRKPSGAADEPLLAPMEAIVAPAPSMPPMPPVERPTAGPTDAVRTPAPPMPPADQPVEEGDLRLAARVDVNGYATGALQVFLDGAFGAVCSFTFGPADADVACRQMGFTGGTSLPLALLDAPSLRSDVSLQDVVAPFVLENLDCAGTEESLLDCPGVMEERPSNGAPADTYSYADRAGLTRCRPTESGYAFVACGMTEGPETRLLTPRLVGGRADPAGAWEYGRLQVFDGAVFSTLDGGLGRSGIELACRTLGYATGAQLLGGPALGLPAVEATPVTLRSIMCAGDAATLIDCTAERARPSSFDSDAEGEGIAALCFNPSGCTVDGTPPAQGDLRLVNPRNSEFMTQPCDDVHFGAIEFFNEGRWGRICADSGDQASPTVEATVMCRQLGFPFGSLIGLREVRDQSGRTASADDYIEYGEPEELVWEENVLCTGLEERLEECAFPGRFGNPPGVSGTPDLPSPGLSPSICGRRDGLLLGLACRRFEVEESDTIRRL